MIENGLISSFVKIGSLLDIEFSTHKNSKGLFALYYGESCEENLIYIGAAEINFSSAIDDLTSTKNNTTKGANREIYIHRNKLNFSVLPMNEYSKIEIQKEATSFINIYKPKWNRIYINN